MAEYKNLILKTIKLIAIDMDGTLLDSRKRVPVDFEQWVLDHKNIKVVAASGRQYYTLRDMFPSARDQLLYSAEIKAVAQHETTSNDEDGVMRVLRRLS